MGFARLSSRTASFATVAVAAALASGGVAVAASPHGYAGAMPRAHASSASTSDWTVYHRFADGSGEGAVHIDLDHLKRAWVSHPLQGQLYGEPLVFGKDVFVATEDDTAYELSAASGKVIWRRHLATPVPASALPCGNVSPTVGVTGTPVLDRGRKEIFFVADELVKGSPHHELYGLSTSSGKVLLRQAADPPGVSVRAQLQRTGVALDKNRVVFGFGGNDGDCSTYHGWVESVPVAGGKAKYFEVDRRKGDDQGAVWMGGAAPAVLGNGDLFVAAGNGSVGSPSGHYDDSDSVLELSPTMRLLQFFAPSDWYSDNAHDRDLGSSVPALLGNGLVVQAGKSQTAYLLRQGHLGGVGGEVKQIHGVCGADVDGGVATVGPVVYEPCENGLIAISTDAKNRTIRQLWQASNAGGPPITAGGRLWSISGSTLYGLSRITGKALEQVSIASNANDFPTPSVGDGLLLAPTTNQVYAFR